MPGCGLPARCRADFDPTNNLIGGTDLITGLWPAMPAEAAHEKFTKDTDNFLSGAKHPN
jgi:hypothetical protein